MSEYDPWAAVYDAWSADMTEVPYADDSPELVWVTRKPAR